MDELISRIKATVETGVSLDLEILLDDLILAYRASVNNQKEELHNLGRSLQMYYDDKVHSLITIITYELMNIKSNQSIDPQYMYKTLKKILEILQSFQTVF